MKQQSLHSIYVLYGHVMFPPTYGCDQSGWGGAQKTLRLYPQS